ncbi:hypothetical protein KIPB_007372, partial [Kipferlia bialata]
GLITGIVMVLIAGACVFLVGSIYPYSFSKDSLVRMALLGVMGVHIVGMIVGAVAVYISLR